MFGALVLIVLIFEVLNRMQGGSFLFNGILVRELPPFTIVTARVALAALALWTIVRISGHAVPRSREVWLAFFGMGVLNNIIPFSLIVWGQTHIASGLASILNATTPLWGVLVAHLLTHDEKATPTKLIGVGFGVVGVAVVMGGSSAMEMGGAWKRLGPMKENGEARSETTGSVNQNRPCSLSSRVEWPRRHRLMSGAAAKSAWVSGSTCSG